jgi:hypothetical protein
LDDLAISSGFSVILRSVLCDVRISFTHSVILSSPEFLPDDVRILFFKIFYKE